MILSEVTVHRHVSTSHHSKIDHEETSTPLKVFHLSFSLVLNFLQVASEKALRDLYFNYKYASATVPFCQKLSTVADSTGSAVKRRVEMTDQKMQDCRIQCMCSVKLKGTEP